MISFPSLVPGASQALTFDFISQLALGESLSSATVTATVWSGTDPTPSSLLSGSASVSGTRASQTVAPLLEGNIYKLTCAAITSLSQVLMMVGYLAVVKDPL